MLKDEKLASLIIIVVKDDDYDDFNDLYYNNRK